MHEIKDNLLPSEIFAEVQSVMLGKYFPWYFTNDLVYNNEGLGQFCFMHTFFFENKVTSDFYNLLTPILNQLDIKALIRIKANLYTKTEKVLIHSSHTDYDFSHKGALFYINSNNGHTMIEPNIKIASVENRLVTFDSSKPHCSSTCSDESRRVNIVINYF